ncbi:unnamed protein product [Linum trigynum]|uniref:Reverse transcriptase n=1 Tax=Linum trigynum TaxID=586398 RepID=A0AAV2FMU6_9ROSI
MKLKVLKDKLKKLNRESYSDISTRAREVELELTRGQSEVLLFPNEDNVVLELEQAAICSEILKAEESLYRQKSRVRYVQEGDANTAYFYRLVKVRNHKQSIKRLLKDDGTKVTAVKKMRAVAVEFYQLLLGNKDAAVQGKDVAYYRSFLKHTLDAEASASLMTPVTREEIRKVFKNMPNDKAPGPDGFPAEFYKGDWTIIGESVEEVVLEFFRTGIMPKHVNSTILTLIPKLPVVDRMKNLNQSLVAM